MNFEVLMSVLNLLDRNTNCGKLGWTSSIIDDTYTISFCNSSIKINSKPEIRVINEYGETILKVTEEFLHIELDKSNFEQAILHLKNIYNGAKKNIAEVNSILKSMNEELEKINAEH